MKVLDVEVKKVGIGYTVGAKTTMYERDAKIYEDKGFLKILGIHKSEDIPERANKKAPESNKK